MKRKTNQPQTGRGPERTGAKPIPRKWTVESLVSLGLVVVAVGVGTSIVLRSNRQESTIEYVRRPTGVLSFNKDIAPIVFEHCAGCHRPGQSAPFPLLTYQDVKKRADLIGDVTQRRYMPPWLPEPGYGEFNDERRLTTDQIGLIGQWVKEGGAEGNPSDLPPTPAWTGGWHLGEPDLVVTLAEAYRLAAEGKDVYRNFVVPVPLETTRYVSAVELQPGNPKIVHHAFVKVDRTGQSRRIAGKDGAPGFGGMNRSESAQMPDGHFLTWQPGKVPSRAPEGLAWTLEKGSDLVLEMHLRPSGKPEAISAANPRNPNNPPRRVEYGPQSSDEMAELWLQLLPRTRNELPTLVDDYEAKKRNLSMAYAQYLLGQDPDNVKAHTELGLIWLGLRRYEEARTHLQTAIQLQPQQADAHYYLGLLHRQRKQFVEARREFELTLRIDPQYHKAHGNLGLLFMEQGNLDLAESHLRKALHLNPEDELARENLAIVLDAKARQQIGK